MALDPMNSPAAQIARHRDLLAEYSVQIINNTQYYVLVRNTSHSNTASILQSKLYYYHYLQYNTA
jgi:hypothetical protein